MKNLKKFRVFEQELIIEEGLRKDAIHIKFKYKGEEHPGMVMGVDNEKKTASIYSDSFDRELEIPLADIIDGLKEDHEEILNPKDEDPRPESERPAKNLAPTTGQEEETDQERLEYLQKKFPKGKHEIVTEDEQIEFWVTVSDFSRVYRPKFDPIDSRGEDVNTSDGYQWQLTDDNKFMATQFGGDPESDSLGGEEIEEGEEPQYNQEVLDAYIRHREKGMKHGESVAATAQELQLNDQDVEN